MVLFERSTRWQQIKLDHNVSFRPNNPSTSSIMLSYILGLNTQGSNGRPTGTGPDDLRLWWIRGNHCFPIPWEDALSEHHRFPIDVPHVLFSADSATSSLWFYSIAKRFPSNPLLIKSKCLRYAVIVLLFVQLSHSVY